MAEEAFALSPISARAAQPSEEDYAAISEAFMETSRGRWFLGEYAKRNRNADTRMVLDAVARIEQSLAEQRQATVEAIRDEQLEAALTVLRGAVEAAQASALAALDGVSFEPQLAPVRKGVRVIREISWRLREIGNDGRICDLIDSQASAIEAGAAQLSMDDARAVLDAAFAGLARRLGELDANEAVTPAAAPTAAETPADAPAAAASPPPIAETAAAEVVATEPLPASETAATPAPEPAVAETPQPDQTALAKAEAALAEAEAAELARAADEAAADAHDEAMLDLIAAEMGAPDPIDDEEAAIAEEIRVAEAMAEPEMAPPAPEPAFAPAPEPVAPPAPLTAPAPVAELRIAETQATPPARPLYVEAAPAPVAEVSLGSTIIASGLVKRPSAAANDPLAPIRRMSQVERIAFFS
ncbi:hypothetical protein IC762_24460 [Bradyrhizobium genosp. L]|uniref:hypothetical protein n=1 Tax=Bradyrhizobium genosp. L TaxID=83637 RepID=UPI0018A311D5|nr:hypothetical protein [Bradyrhizobium genosp. L]QPF82881.1 hypothetical protein IC762_24460 [Bradyrhizobium genosp. L]